MGTKEYQNKFDSGKCTQRKRKRNVLQEKAVEATKQKEDKRKKPKPEERDGMPQRQHCPPKQPK
jgi:hypothetical protein